MPPTSTPAATTLPQDLRFDVAITKVDKDKRTVRGVATAEVVDSHEEIVDYETAKSVMQSWRGNIREMHQPVAVGKRVDMEFDDVNKQIIVESYISKGAPETWEKVLDGTLNMYSLGARGVKKLEKSGTRDVKRIFLTSMGELSLVDNGACPTANFSIVKMDGEQPVDEQPADPTPVGRELLKTLVLGTAGISKTLLAAIDAGGLEVTIEKRVESYDIQNALRAISYLEELVSSEMWQASYATTDCQAPDPEGPAQIAMLKAAAELLLAFLISEFMSQFEETAAAGTETATVENGADIKAMRVLDNKGNPISEWFGANVMKAFGGLDVTAFAVNVMKVGKRHSKDDESLIQNMHDASLTLGAVCKAVEAKAEPKADEETAAEKLAKAAAAAAPEPIVKTDDLPAPAAGDGDRITKLEGELSTSKSALTSAQELIQKQQESVTALELRLKKLEDSPAPGGPVARVVPIQKSIGSGESAAIAAESAEGNEVLKAFDTLAAAATTDEKRAELAMQKLAFMTANGLNAVDARTGRAHQ